jgi:hypothetical protein
MQYITVKSSDIGRENAGLDAARSGEDDMTVLILWRVMDGESSSCFI